MDYRTSGLSSFQIMAYVIMFAEFMVLYAIMKQTKYQENGLDLLQLTYQY